jgi:hypothetical protein
LKNGENLKKEILNTIEGFDKIIISPDMDGFISAKLLNRFNGSVVVGTYDKNILCLSDGVDPKDCLFVDCDINNFDYVSIGNHMRMANDRMSEKSFNPNIHFEITKYSDKFPFATAYLIAFATGIETSATEMIRMAYADSTLRNMESYSENMRVWSERMNCPAVEYVIHNTDVAKQIDDGIRTVYTKQSFTNRAYGKPRYIQELSDNLIKENVSHETIVDGYKYKTDKVGAVTVKKYMADIFSYAEVFGGEYSVTYYDRMEW